MEVLRKLQVPSTCRRLYPTGIESCTSLLPKVGLACDTKRFASQQSSSQNDSLDNSTPDNNVVNLSARIRTASGSIKSDFGISCGALDIGSQVA